MNGKDAIHPATPGLLNNYLSAVSGYDETRQMDGSRRSCWADLLGGLDSLGNEELKERWKSCRRILRNHGVSYHVHAKAGSLERPWELDLIPHVMDAREWETIEQGVIQRAKLHHLILQDIYSNQQYLLRDGCIPPALVFANPNFLRTCRRLPVPGNRFLHLHAVDLARAPDGNWYVLDDRMQCPNGLGYALENRAIIGRIHSDLFAEMGICGMEPFFNLLHQNLLELVPKNTSFPRVVFWTPGSESAAHYEQSVLARYFGYTLVEAGDLTVRGNKVYLKTVEGIQRVDIIVRRINDALCDPLELEPSSVYGVPGLVQAIRAGNLVLANALGSAVVETPALMQFLPEISAHLLKEPLLLPNAPTWWCGDVRHSRYVLDNLDKLIVKNAFTTDKRRTYSGPELSNSDREQLAHRIQQHPHDYIGQSTIHLSNAPGWNGTGLEARPIVLRVFVASRGDSYAVLPGGLTKASSDVASPVKGLQLAGGSKDTWVLSNSYKNETSPAIILEGRPAERLQTGVPSRTADNFFWIGRYSERLERLLQMLACMATRLIDRSGQRSEEQMQAMSRMLGEYGISPFASEDQEKMNIDSKMLEVYFDPDCPGGVAELCHRLFLLASSVRDRFSSQAWRVINFLKDFPGTAPNHMSMGRLLTPIHELLNHLAALSGIEMENIVRGHEWRFMDFGKRLERSQSLCTLIRLVMSRPEDTEMLLNPLLEICDSSMTYRRQHYSEPESKTVLESLLLNPDNPRALKFNVEMMKQHSKRLPTYSDKAGAAELIYRIQRLNNEVRSPLVNRIMRAATSVKPDRFDKTLDHLQAQLNGISESITLRYFSLIKHRF